MIVLRDTEAISAVADPALRQLIELRISQINECCQWDADELGPMMAKSLKPRQWGKVHRCWKVQRFPLLRLKFPWWKAQRFLSRQKPLLKLKFP